MVTLHDSLLSSSARSLSIRRRPDLIARRQHYLGRSYWVVKDPVGLNYFRFQEEEYALLNWLNGSVSLDELKDRFEDEFPPQKITLEELQQFLGMLHRSGLVIAAVGGQGKQLLKRRRERRRKEFLGALSNVLCIRFKGFDPERLLNWLYPLVGWFYTFTAMAACILLGLSALTLVTVQFHVFTSRLPAFHEFFSFHNALLLSITLGVTKVLHEFGHGLMCKHFGGECHEMGVMVLVLTPCLYCNVSDSWLLPNKWARAAIGAGGMYVELVLASIATWIWWFSEPGQLLNNLCLNVMFVCSVSTLIFNANPLLRYDGYYILSDITEIPNLRQKSTAVLSRKMGEWFLGLEQPDDPFLPERNQIFFALYSVAAAIYQWVVVYSILFFLYHVFKPYKLEKIGQLLALASLWGLIVMPLYQLGKFFYVPGRLEKVKKARMFASLAGVIAILAAVFLIPLPHTVMAIMEIQPQGAEQVYVSGKGGCLAEVDVKAGQAVVKGQRLAVLENKDLDMEIAKLAGKENEYEVKEDNLRRLNRYERKPSETIPELDEALISVRKQRMEEEADRARLTLTADRDGTVLPPPPKPATHQKPIEGAQLPSWSGTPLDEESYRPFLKEGTLFCLVGDPRKLQAVLVIDQGDIDYVQENQEVDMKLDALPNDTLHGKIERIAVSNLKITPPGLSTKAKGELASKTDESGLETPQSASYQALVPISDDEGVMLVGLRGRAKIHTAPLSLGSRLWRFIMNTFHFRL